MYADDLVLISNSKEGLQKCLDELDIYCNTWRLNINMEKIQIISFNKGGKLITKHKFYYEGAALQTVQEYKYLGIEIKSSGIFRKGISELQNKAKKVLFYDKSKISVIAYISSFASQTL